MVNGSGVEGTEGVDHHRSKHLAVSTLNPIRPPKGTLTVVVTKYLKNFKVPKTLAG